MAQVFARYTKASGLHKPGDLDWVGEPQLKLSKAYLEAVTPESEEAKAEVVNVMTNVPGIALAPIDETPPHAFDIRNPFRVERGMLFVEWRDSQPARNVRWDFRERIMDIWEGRRGFNILERKPVLRSFLKYQWENGGSREAFVDYIEAVPDEQWHRDKIPGEIILSQRDFIAPVIEKPLADELHSWVTDLRAYPSTVSNRLHEKEMRDEVPGLSVCPFPWNISVGSRNTYGLEDYSHGVWPGACFQLIDRLDTAHRQHIEEVMRKALRKSTDSALRSRFAEWTYADIEPKGRTPNPLDIWNPRTYLLDGTPVPKYDRYRLDLKLNSRLKEIWRNAPLNLKAKQLHEFLDHHLTNGGSPEALVNYVELIGPSVYRNPSTGEREPVFTDRLQKELAAWVASARKRLESPSKVKTGPKAVKPSGPTLASKFEPVPGSLDKWMNLLRAEGLVDDAGRFTMSSDVRGKGKLIAAWDAAQSVFSLAPFPSGAALMRALNKHFDGLAFSGRLDRVRFTKEFDGVRDGYKKVLRGN